MQLKLPYRKIKLFIQISILFTIVFFILIDIFCNLSFADDQAIQNKKNNDFYSEYSTLIKSLQDNGIKVPECFKKEVEEYLHSKKAFVLIGFAPSNEYLRWNFHHIIFLRPDLVFASYDDGEMYGGDFLLKVDYSGEQVISIKTLWNSAEFIKK